VADRVHQQQAHIYPQNLVPDAALRGASEAVCRLLYKQHGVLGFVSVGFTVLRDPYEKDRDDISSSSVAGGGSSHLHTYDGHHSIGVGELSADELELELWGTSISFGMSPTLATAGMVASLRQLGGGTLGGGGDGAVGVGVGVGVGGSASVGPGSSLAQSSLLSVDGPVQVLGGVETAVPLGPAKSSQAQAASGSSSLPQLPLVPTDRCFVLIPLLHHDGLLGMREDKFFRLCRLHGAAYDAQARLGTLFFLPDHLSSSCLTICTVAATRARALDFAVGALHTIVHHCIPATGRSNTRDADQEHAKWNSATDILLLLRAAVKREKPIAAM
jgi:hypothetical protein